MLLFYLNKSSVIGPWPVPNSLAFSFVRHHYLMFNSDWFFGSDHAPQCHSAKEIYWPAIPVWPLANMRAHSLHWLPRVANIQTSPSQVVKSINISFHARKIRVLFTLSSNKRYAKTPAIITLESNQNALNRILARLFIDILPSLSDLSQYAYRRPRALSVHKSLRVPRWNTLRRSP